MGGNSGAGSECNDGEGNEDGLGVGEISEVGEMGGFAGGETTVMELFRRSDGVDCVDDDV